MYREKCVCMYMLYIVWSRPQANLRTCKALPQLSMRSWSSAEGSPKPQLSGNCQPAPCHLVRSQPLSTEGSKLVIVCYCAFKKSGWQVLCGMNIPLDGGAIAIVSVSLSWRQDLVLVQLTLRFMCCFHKQHYII